MQRGYDHLDFIVKKYGLKLNSSINTVASNSHSSGVGTSAFVGGLTQEPKVSAPQFSANVRSHVHNVTRGAITSEFITTGVYRGLDGWLGNWA